MRCTKLLPLVLLSSLLAGCIGTNKAYGHLSAANSRLTDDRYANGAIGVALWIVPLYPVSIAADILVFNTVEFWSGKSWLSDPEPMRPMTPPAETAPKQEEPKQEAPKQEPAKAEPAPAEKK
ncbi:MAG: hypothetical protein RL148_29 [Planctomycetota bacterium]|jgi:hypothetical protein